MSELAQRYVPAIVRWTAIGCAVVALGTVIGLIGYRLQYPYELEWMEGAMMDHVRRVIAGKQIYVTPSLEFVPFVYPPGFYYVAAAVTQIVGGELVPLRLVSVVSFLGSVALLVSFVYRETRDRDFAVIAGGLFAATFERGGAWFDVGRVDMLLLLLLLSAFYLLRFGSRPRTFVISGILLAAAFLTKQSAAVIVIPVVVWLALVRWRMAAVVVAAGGVAALSAILALNTMTDGWFSYYVFEMPSGYSLWPEGKMRFWTRDLIPAMPIALAVAAAYLCTPKAPKRGFYFGMTAGLVACAWMLRVKVGGFNNVLIPAHAALALLTGLALSTWRPLVCARIPARFSPGTWLYAIAIGQFLMLAYNPIDHLPRASSLAAGDALVRTIRETSGPVWVPYHPFLVEKAGKPGHAHWMAISEVLSQGTPKLREELSAEIKAAISGRRYEMIVLSSYPIPDFPPLGDSYQWKRDLLYADKKVFLPLTGATRRPEKIYQPK